MNKSHLINVLLATALILLSIRIVTSSDDDSYSDDATSEVKAQSIQELSDTWQKVSPEDVKRSPVTLFSKDWMALAVGRKGDMNAMTIAWGGLGELWGRHVVTVYVSSSRYTYSFMERNEYFTVTAFPEKYRPALQYIGTHSGRDGGDKIKDAGLTTTFTELGNPIFEEANLAIECKIIYSAPFNPDKIDPDVKHIYDMEWEYIPCMLER